jgi:hypothetical protein
MVAPDSVGIVARATRLCEANASVCLGIIVVLLILVLVMYVYYHGVFGFGPYHKTPEQVALDEETEKLIEVIRAN